MFRRWRVGKGVYLILCQFLLLCFFCLYQIDAFLGVDDQNFLQISSLQYNAALHAWTVDLGSLPSHVLITVQMCASMSSSQMPCSPFRFEHSHVACSKIIDFLQNSNWMLVGMAHDRDLGTFVAQQPCALMESLQVVDPLVRIAYPTQIQIINNSTLLKRHAFDFGNESFDFQMQIGVFRYLDSLFLPHLVVYRSLITIPNPTINTLGVQHICAERGFIAPPKSVLILSEKQLGSIFASSCLWKCGPSHVRQPFNKPPLLASSFSNNSLRSYSPMCVPIPTEYVATSVEMNLYVETTSDYEMYSQKLYDAIDNLVNALMAKAKEIGLSNPIILIKHRGSLYDTLDFQSLLQQHSFHQENLNTLKSYRLISSGETAEAETFRIQSRRLLQTNSIEKTDIQLEGLIISGESVDQQASEFVAEVENMVDSTVETFVFEPELKVSALSKPVITSYTRNRATASSTSFVADSFSWNRLLLFAVEMFCIVLILMRCNNQGQDENNEIPKTSNRDVLPTVRVDFNNEMMAKNHMA